VSSLSATGEQRGPRKNGTAIESRKKENRSRSRKNDRRWSRFFTRGLLNLIRGRGTGTKKQGKDGINKVTYSEEYRRTNRGKRSRVGEEEGNFWWSLRTLSKARGRAVGYLFQDEANLPL